MSGTGHATKTVAAQGNQGIDGLLTPVVWGTATIDYSFPTVRSVYGYSVLTGLPAGFFGATAAQKTAAHFALDADPGGRPGVAAGFAVEGFTGLGVQLDSTPDADQIRLANTTAASLGTARVADFPGNYVDRPGSRTTATSGSAPPMPARSTTTPPRPPETTPGSPTSTRSAMPSA